MACLQQYPSSFLSSFCHNPQVPKGPVQSIAALVNWSWLRKQQLRRKTPARGVHKQLWCPRLKTLQQDNRNLCFRVHWAISECRASKSCYQVGLHPQADLQEGCIPRRHLKVLPGQPKEEFCVHQMSPLRISNPSHRRNCDPKSDLRERQCFPEESLDMAVLSTADGWHPRQPVTSLLFTQHHTSHPEEVQHCKTTHWLLGSYTTNCEMHITSCCCSLPVLIYWWNKVFQVWCIQLPKKMCHIWRFEEDISGEIKQNFAFHVKDPNSFVKRKEKNGTNCSHFTMPQTSECRSSGKPACYSKLFQSTCKQATNFHCI